MSLRYLIVYCVDGELTHPDHTTSDSNKEPDEHRSRTTQEERSPPRKGPGLKDNLQGR